MFVLKYAHENNHVDQWKEKLSEMVVTYQFQRDHSLHEPVLIQGNYSVQGNEAIERYLEDLEGELRSWWYCSC